MSSYAVLPVEALLSAVLPVETYFTEKEIIRKKREKKKRGEQKRTEDVPVVPPSRVAFVVSVSHVSSRSTYYCTLRKKRQPERRRRVEEASRKNANITEDVRLPPIPPCVAVAVRVVLVPLGFSPSRSSLIHLPSPSQQAPVDGKEGQRRCQRKNNKNLTINLYLTFCHPKPRPCCYGRNGDGGETTDDRQRETTRRGRKHEGPAELAFVYRPLFYCCCIICERGL